MSVTKNVNSRAHRGRKLTKQAKMLMYIAQRGDAGACLRGICLAGGYNYNDPIHLNTVMTWIKKEPRITSPMDDAKVYANEAAVKSWRMHELREAAFVIGVPMAELAGE